MDQSSTNGPSRGFSGPAGPLDTAQETYRRGLQTPSVAPLNFRTHTTRDLLHSRDGIPQREGTLLIRQHPTPRAEPRAAPERMAGPQQ